MFLYGFNMDLLQPIQRILLSLLWGGALCLDLILIKREPTNISTKAQDKKMVMTMFFFFF